MFNNFNSLNTLTFYHILLFSLFFLSLIFIQLLIIHYALLILSHVLHFYFYCKSIIFSCYVDTNLIVIKYLCLFVFSIVKSIYLSIHLSIAVYFSKIENDFFIDIYRISINFLSIIVSVRIAY